MSEEAKVNKPAPNRSLRRKQAARLTAIRALYSGHFDDAAAGLTVDARADQLIALQQEAIQSNDAETAFTDAPERAMLVTLLESAQQHEAVTTELIHDCMGEKWAAGRMGPLLESILRVAVAELMAKKDRNPGIIISEYVNLTQAYFDEGEVSFINGILSGIVKKLRE